MDLQTHVFGPPLFQHKEKEDWVKPMIVMEGDMLELDRGTVGLEPEG